MRVHLTLALLGLLALLHAQAEPLKLRVAGPAGLAPLMAKLSKAFAVHTNQTYDIEYSGMRPDQARCRLLNRDTECAVEDRANAPNEVDAIVNEGIMPNAAYAAYPDVQLYPILAQAVVAVYNIPNVDNLVFISSTAGNIYSALDPMDESGPGFKYYRWNVTVLMTANGPIVPSLQASAARGRIMRFVRSDVSSSTETFRWAITASNDDTDTLFNGANFEIQNQPTWNGIQPRFASSEMTMAALVNATENAIGYMTLTDALRYRMKIAAIGENSILQNGYRRPTLESLEMGLRANGENFGNFNNDPERLMANIVGGTSSTPASRRLYAGTEAWPMMSYAYLGVRKNTLVSGSTCEGRRLGVYRFAEWLLTSKAAHRLMNMESMVPPLPETRQVVLGRFYNQFQCQGTPVFGSPAWDNGTSAALIASLNDSPRMVRIKTSDSEERLLVNSLASVYGKGQTGVVKVEAVDQTYSGTDALEMVLVNQTETGKVSVPLLKVAWGAVYNVNGLKNLVLTVELLRLIKEGSIFEWNDARIINAQTDPAVRLRLAELSGRIIEVVFYEAGSSADQIVRRFLGEGLAVKSTSAPSRSPTVAPSSSPSSMPFPAPFPTLSPTTTRPSRSPSTTRPSKAPTTTRPSKAPTTTRPSASPSTSRPSVSPSTSMPSASPSTSAPSSSPDVNDTWGPSVSPTTKPSMSPSTSRPSKAPTTSRPSRGPTTSRPSKAPTTSRPSVSPTLQAPGHSYMAENPFRARGYVAAKQFTIAIVPMLEFVETDTLNVAQIVGASGQVEAINAPNYPLTLQYAIRAPAQFAASMCMDGTAQENALFVQFASSQIDAVLASAYTSELASDAEVSAAVASLTCFGASITQPPVDMRLVPQALLWAIRVLGFVLLLVCLCLQVWITVNRKLPVINKASPIFLVQMLFGCMLMILALYPLSMQEGELGIETDSVLLDDACAALPWLVSLGFVFMYAPLFAKTYRLARIFNNPKMLKVRIQNSQLLAMEMVALVPVLAILIAWQVDEPLRWERAVIQRDSVTQLPLVSEGFCVSSMTSVYAGLLVAFAFLNILVGSYLAYTVRNVPTDFSEGKHISGVLAMLVESFALGIPVIVLAANTPTAGFVVKVMFILRQVCALITIFYMPKAAIKYGWWSADPLSSATKGDKTGTGMAATKDNRDMVRMVRTMTDADLKSNQSLVDGGAMIMVSHQNVSGVTDENLGSSKSVSKQTMFLYKVLDDPKQRSKLLSYFKGTWAEPELRFLDAAHSNILKPTQPLSDDARKANYQALLETFIRDKAPLLLTTLPEQDRKQLEKLIRLEISPAETTKKSRTTGLLGSIFGHSSRNTVKDSEAVDDLDAALEQVFSRIASEISATIQFQEYFNVATPSGRGESSASAGI